MKELAKNFDPSVVEERLYNKWAGRNRGIVDIIRCVKIHYRHLGRGKVIYERGVNFIGGYRKFLVADSFVFVVGKLRKAHVDFAAALEICDDILCGHGIAV